MAHMTDHAKHFVDTWPAFKRPVNLDAIDTDIYRVGWPSPTLYTEHEVIHVMANVIDALLAERQSEEALAARLGPIVAEMQACGHDHDGSCGDCQEDVQRILKALRP